MPELPLVGDEFAGYRLRAVLGRGGMSTVYQAENPRLGNVIALKVLAPELASDDVFRTRFLEESRIAAAMNHPHVIPIHDMGASDGLLYIAMRCVSGTDLRQMISKRGRLLPETSVFLLSQAARALDAAHRRGLVHRDVKPGNLLVERGNDDSGSDPDHLYLADFGITKPAIGRSGLTSSGQFLGTIDYVAPEQIRGLAVLGMADQYSLGCVLYECLTGRVPFEKDLDAAIIWAHVEETPTQATLLRPDLPAAIDEVFGQVLAKQPGDRYASCREFMTAARSALRVPETAVTPRPSTDVSLRASRTAPPLADYQELAHDPGAGGPGLIASGARAGRPPALSLLSAPPDVGAAPLRDALPHADGPAFPGGTGYAGRYAQPGGTDDEGPGDPRGWSPPRRVRRNHEGLRVPLLVLAAAIVIAAGAGIGTAISLSRGAAAAPSPSMSMRASASAPAPSKSAASTSAASASAASAMPKPTATGLPASALVTALEPVQNFTGRLSLAACKEPSPTLVTCANPDPKGAIASATFQTFATLNALYTAYQANVAAMAGKPFRAVENTQDCGLAAPQPMAEISWNHSDQHTLKYSVAQMASGTVPYDIAAGRMFCIQLPGGGENIIWTENFGHLLVVAKGAVSHEQVWLWFVSVHHNVAFKGAPAMPGM